MSTVTLQARPVAGITLKSAVQAAAAGLSSGECGLIGASITTVASVASAFIPVIGPIIAPAVVALGGAITAYACEDSIGPEQAAALAGAGYDMGAGLVDPGVPDYDF